MSAEEKEKILTRARRMRRDKCTWKQIAAITGKSDFWLMKNLKGA